VDLGSLFTFLNTTRHGADSQEGATAFLRDTAAALAEVCALCEELVNIAYFFSYRTFCIRRVIKRGMMQAARQMWSLGLCEFHRRLAMRATVDLCATHLSVTWPYGMAFEFSAAVVVYVAYLTDFTEHRPVERHVKSLITTIVAVSSKGHIPLVYSQLQTWSKTRFSTRFLTFWVENLVANLMHQSRHIEIDAAGSQQVRCVVHVLSKWSVEKKNVLSQPTNLLELNFPYLFYYSSNVPTSILRHCTYRLISQSHLKKAIWFIPSYLFTSIYLNIDL